MINLTTNEYAFLFLLLFISILDVKEKKIPAVLGTGLIIIGAILNFKNSLSYGLLGALFGLLMMELDFFKGVADLKIFTFLCFNAFNFNMLFFVLISTLIVGAVYNFVFYFYYKKIKNSNIEEIPFIPVFFFVYLLFAISF